MGVDLRIFIIGYIALVPDYKDAIREQGTLTVVLPESRGSAQHPHHPVLVFECKDHISSEDQKKCELASDIDSSLLLPTDQYGAVTLNGYDLILDGAQASETPSPVAFTPGRKHRFYHSIFGEVPSAESSRAFAWIPSIASVTGGDGGIHESLVTPNRYQLAGRLRANNFKAEASTFGFVDDEGLIRSFVFKRNSFPSLVDDRQALPDIALLSVPLKTSEVTLVLKEFYPSDRVRYVKLRDVDGNGYIDIVLGNLPPFLACGVGTGDAGHFALYYRLLSHHHAPVEVPVAGAMSVKVEEIEGRIGDLPPIVSYVQDVEGERCQDGFHGHRHGPQSGIPLPPVSASNRPICALAVFGQ